MGSTSRRRAPTTCRWGGGAAAPPALRGVLRACSGTAALRRGGQSRDPRTAWWRRRPEPCACCGGGGCQTPAPQPGPPRLTMYGLRAVAPPRAVHLRHLCGGGYPGGRRSADRPGAGALRHAALRHPASALAASQATTAYHGCGSRGHSRVCLPPWACQAVQLLHWLDPRPPVMRGHRLSRAPLPVGPPTVGTAHQPPAAGADPELQGGAGAA